MLNDREKKRVGKVIASLSTDRKSLLTEEGGLCRLRSAKGIDHTVNRHYAIGGPGYEELWRSHESHESENTVPYHCRFDIFEYGQTEGSDCIRRLSWLSLQIKVSELQCCRQQQNLSANEANFISQCFRVRGRVNRILDYEPDKPFCSDRECAGGEKDAGMYPCRMKAAPMIVENNQTVEFVYHVEEQNGRLIYVLDHGKLRTYSFTPESFISKGGFGPTQLSIIM